MYICKHDISFEWENLRKYCITNAKSIFHKRSSEAMIRNLHRYANHTYNSQVSSKLVIKTLTPSYLECDNCNEWRTPSKNVCEFLNHIDNCSK